MCRGRMHEFLQALPKCEHHMHIEGSLEPALLFELSARNNVALPSPTEDPAYESVATLQHRYNNFTSLDDFLHYYFIGMTVLTSAADFESLAYAYFRKAHDQNVRHAEIFFDPQAHTGRGVPYHSLLSGLKTAQTRAKTDFGLTSELIVCMLRHLNVGDCHQTFLEALPDILNGQIRGLGLSSTELDKPPTLYKVSYDHAREQGVKYLTAHAGEEGPVEYMASAVHDLGCVRIDHGIKLTHDPNLLAHFVAHKILTTLCPISSFSLKCVPNIANLPIREYLAAGVPFSINSDDPAYFGGGAYIQENYCAVQDAFTLSRGEWLRIAENAIDGSWCSDDRKAELRRLLEETARDFEEI